MKKFITITQKDKEFFKMINQTETGFDLIVISDSKIQSFMNDINCNDTEIYIAWQQKFRHENFSLYRKCIFSKPEDNYIKSQSLFAINKKCGVKMHVSCSAISYFTSNKTFINKKVRYSTHSYKDSKLLTRMLKIGELNSTEDESKY